MECYLQRYGLPSMESTDVLIAGSELRQVPDFHTEIEHKMKMNW